MMTELPHSEFIKMIQKRNWKVDFTVAISPNAEIAIRMSGKEAAEQLMNCYGIRFDIYPNEKYVWIDKWSNYITVKG